MYREQEKQQSKNRKDARQFRNLDSYTGQLAQEREYADHVRAALRVYRKEAR
jgi:hypothetical protein